MNLPLIILATSLKNVGTNKKHSNKRQYDDGTVLIRFYGSTELTCARLELESSVAAEVA